MTFNRPLPPMELFIRTLGWAVASSWTHSSASCRDHQGLRDFALIVSLASLLWCLSHKGWELHFQKQGFLIIIYPLCSVWRQRGRFKVMSVNICFFFHCIIRHLFPSLNFSWLKGTIPLWKTVIWYFRSLFALPKHLGRPFMVCTAVRVQKWETTAWLWGAL